jgi:starch phosphorylase
MIRRTLCELAPQLLATRMLRDYVQRLYLPAAAAAAEAVAVGR